MASLYNPTERSTPSQRLAEAARQARLHRFASAAALPVGEQLPGSSTLKTMAPIPNAAMAEAAQIAFPSWVGAIKRIQHAVCAEYGITMTELCSQRRHKKIVRPRQVAMYLCKTLTDRSYPEIGRRFGGRDHTTAISSVTRIEQLCATDEIFRSQINSLAESLGDSLP
jgi:chromosomal replication initiator protein